MIIIIELIILTLMSKNYEIFFIIFNWNGIWLNKYLNFDLFLLFFLFVYSLTGHPENHVYGQLQMNTI